MKSFDVSDDVAAELTAAAGIVGVGIADVALTLMACSSRFRARERAPELSRAVFGDVDFRSLLKRAAWRFQAEFLHEQIAELARDRSYRALFKGFQLFVIPARRLKAVRRAPAKIARCGPRDGAVALQTAWVILRARQR
jgi:hypothetical protein